MSATVSTDRSTPQPLTVQPSSTVAGHFVAFYSPPAGLPVSTAEIQTSLTITTSDGVSLPPTTSTYSLPLLNPIGFPSFGLGNQGTVYLTPIKTAGQAATGSFIVRAGGPGSSGCLWLNSGRAVHKPQAARVVTYSINPGSASGKCLRFGPTTTQAIKVAASIQGYGSGEVAGDLEIVMKSSINGSTRVEVVPVQFLMNVPLELDTGTALWLLLLGILGPLLILYLISWLSARFIAFDQLRVVNLSVPAVRTAEHFSLSAPIEVGAKDATIQNCPTSLRSFAIGSYGFRVRMPWSPMGAVEGRVSSPPRLVLTSLGLQGDGSEGLVTRGLGSIWVAAIDAGSLEVALEGGQVSQLPLDIDLLIILNTQGDPTVQLERIVSDISSKLPKLLDALAAKRARQTQKRLDGSPAVPDVNSLRTEDPTDAVSNEVYLGGYGIDEGPPVTSAPNQPAVAPLEVPSTTDQEQPSSRPGSTGPPVADGTRSDVYLGGYDIDGTEPGV